MKQKIEPVCFPISMYDKYLLKSNWNQLATKQVEFGVGLFERYLSIFSVISFTYIRTGYEKSN